MLQNAWLNVRYVNRTAGPRGVTATADLEPDLDGVHGDDAVHVSGHVPGENAGDLTVSDAGEVSDLTTNTGGV